MIKENSVITKKILKEIIRFGKIKELMIDSMKELAEVVTTALYKTTLNEESGELVVNGVENEENLVINDALDKREDYKTGLMIASIVIVVFAFVCVYLFVVIYKNVQKRKNIK